MDEVKVWVGKVDIEKHCRGKGIKSIKRWKRKKRKKRFLVITLLLTAIMSVLADITAVTSLIKIIFLEVFGTLYYFLVKSRFQIPFSFRLPFRRSVPLSVCLLVNMSASMPLCQSDYSAGWLAIWLAGCIFLPAYCFLCYLIGWFFFNFFSFSFLTLFLMISSHLKKRFLRFSVFEHFGEEDI